MRMTRKRGAEKNVHFLAVTIQLARSCLLDLFAQGLRRSALTDPWRICARLPPRLAQKSASQSLPSQLNCYGLAASDGLDWHRLGSVAWLEKGFCVQWCLMVSNGVRLCP